MCIFQLTAPVVELGFIQAEFTGGGSDTNTLSQFQGFIAELGGTVYGPFCWLMPVLS